MSRPPRSPGGLADQWVYHRGRGTIRKSLAEITLMSQLGPPYLAPEIVLLFKSRSTRPKDNDDFADVESLLDGQRRQWLLDRIAPRYTDHPWLPVLRAGAPGQVLRVPTPQPPEPGSRPQRGLRPRHWRATTAVQWPGWSPPGLFSALASSSAMPIVLASSRLVAGMELAQP
jgi:hypothetical protein